MDKAPEAFRTISEVSDEIEVPQHVLRFWESRFSQIRPMKRGGGRRFYRPEDVDLLRGIRHLLYGEGYTIRGVQRILREQGVAFVQNVWRAGVEPPPPEAEEDAAEDDIDGPTPAGRAEPDLSSLAPPPQRGRDRANSERRAERREPNLAAPGPAMQPLARGIDAEAKRKLAAALNELIECRRLIDAALTERDAVSPSGDA